jgi:hypothetical protein
MARSSSSRVPPRRRAVPLSVKEEITQLRDLDLEGLRARWQSVTGLQAAKHIPKHVLFGTLAYRMQADASGDLDAATSQLLKLAAKVYSKSEILPLTAKLSQRRYKLATGTVLMREWNGQQHRVTVLENGFVFNGETFASLSTIASAITGTKRNGPRFFVCANSLTESLSHEGTRQPGRPLRDLYQGFDRRRVGSGVQLARRSMRCVSRAYIRRQAHAGWTLTKTRYDDGGFSGGSTDRPALQQLLADVKARKVHIIVVEWST